jgi:hypothetical protein
MESINRYFRKMLIGFLTVVLSSLSSHQSITPNTVDSVNDDDDNFHMFI